MHESPRMFGALLRAWRGRRGLSQLDLALGAEVSARHVSFLETGRASPSEAMVLRLASTLDLPLRDQNDLLLAAGHPRRFPEASALPPSIEDALSRLMAQQEPYPLVVLSAAYDVLRMNAAHARLFGPLVASPPPQPNLLELLFDPAGLRPHILDWEVLAERLLMRLRRERLAAPGDARFSALTARLLAYPGVPHFELDPSARLEPVLSLWLSIGGQRLSFLTMVTTFSGAQDITVAELRIESFHPLDEVTKDHCRRLADDR